MQFGIDEIHMASKQEKIGIIESVSQTDQVSTVRKIVSLLSDPDIEIRGEAFGALVSNKSEIAGVLIESLRSDEKNIRAFAALILGNRMDTESTVALRRLTSDDSPMVRSCALGALGYLKAREAAVEIRGCLSDENVEVKKSALKAAVDIGCTISEAELDAFAAQGDEEMERLAVMARQNTS